MALRSPEVVSDNGTAESTLSLVTLALGVEQAMADLRHAVDLARTEIQGRINALQLISREEAADLLNMSQSQLDRLTKSGRLPVVWIDARPRYRLELLGEFVDARTVAPVRTWNRRNTQNRKSMGKIPCETGRRNES